MTRRPRVLFSFGPPTPDANPYTTLLAERVAESADVSYFSWGTAIRGRYDVLHVQWPESLIRPYRRNRLSPAVMAVKLVLAVVVLAGGRLRGKRLVWTVHNRTPHERGPLVERAYMSLFLRLVDHRVYLNRGESDERGRPSSVILHPDYAPVASRPSDVGDPAGMLTFGHLRPYKGVEGLIDVVSDHPDSGALLVVGHAADAEYGAALVARAGSSERIEVQPRLVEQGELSRLIVGADLVVLPYAYVYNSGSLLLSLTLHTPVLVRSSSTTEAIRDEVGGAWVTTFDDELTVDDVSAARRSAATVDRVAGPDLAARTWDECAARHIGLYSSLSGA